MPPESRNPHRLAGRDHVDDFTTTVDAAARFEQERAEDYFDAEDYYRARFA